MPEAPEIEGSLMFHFEHVARILALLHFLLGCVTWVPRSAFSFSSGRSLTAHHLGVLRNWGVWATVESNYVDKPAETPGSHTHCLFA